jgi:hypothetical protein
MSDHLEKARLEQEKKRELWQEQQRARMSQKLKEEPLSLGGGKREEEKGKEQEEEQGDEERQGQETSFASAMARIRKAQGKKNIQKEESKDEGSVEGKTEEAQKSLKNLKNIYRIINGTSAVTVVGIIITFLVMNAQLFFGNFLKVDKVPSLSFPELLLVLLVDFILFLMLVTFLVLIIAIVGLIAEHPLMKFLLETFGLSI